jgi:hypothetical protein
MKRLVTLIACLALAACATSSDNLLVAAKASLEVYTDVYQQAVIDYGTLPPCPTATICHDVGVYSQLKAIDAGVTAAISTAQPVLDGKVGDTGQLTALLDKIVSAETSISSKITVKKGS